MSSHLIDVRGITKIFRSKLLQRPSPALRGVDLTVGEGEIFGFLGPNGAGKTTTIKILLGLIRPTSGTGHVLDRPFGSVEARRLMGFLPDSPSFYRYLNARELLTFAGRLHGMRGADLRTRIEATLDRVGLAEPARARQLRTYSRGMLQRTGIAAAILPGPRLVILDEPMNGLDPLGRRDFRDLILALKREGVTVFLSSHVLADIESTADRVAILNEGRMVECGALDDILATGDRRIELCFEPVQGEIPTGAERGLANLRPGSGGWIGEAADPDDANRVVSAILSAGGKLLSYQPRRTSLEDFFMRRVREEDAAAARPVSRPQSSGRHERPRTPSRQEVSR
jgi:ABC-2 type transport system ATP-binding protein